MTTRARVLLTLAVAALLVAGFFACFERRPVEVAVPPSAEARRNPYLALSRLLERMGNRVECLDDPSRLDALPEPPATVILPTPRWSISAARSDALLAWVKRGGNLVVVTYTIWDDARRRPDLLLDRFDLRQHLRQEPSEKPAAPGQPPPFDRPLLPPTPAETLLRADGSETTEDGFAWFDGRDEPLIVEFDDRFYWEDARGLAEWAVEGPSGAHLVDLHRGEGTLVAVTDDLFMRNDWLAEADNAEFLVRMLRLHAAPDGRVWIYYGEEWPGFLELLWQRGWPLLVGLAALLALWLWRAGARFGPLALPAPLARRRWLEHLEAVGRFHWRGDRARALLLATRAAVLEHVRTRHPAWSRLPEAERAERIARACGLDAAAVGSALQGSARRAREFVAAISVLERVRATL